MTKKIPPNSKMVNKNAKRLKYLSIKFFIGLPNNFIKKETNINLAALLTVAARMKSGNWMLNAPALIVNILKGMGVNPAVNTIIKLYSSYKDFILVNMARSNPGILSKKNWAKTENSFGFSHQSHNPIPYPNPAPRIEEIVQRIPKDKAFSFLPRARGIKRTSGGIGKKEASANEIPASTFGPEGLFAQLKTQSYNFLINPILCQIL